MNAVLTDPKAKDRFADIGGAPLGGSAADFHKFITDEIAEWKAIAMVYSRPIWSEIQPNSGRAPPLQTLSTIDATDGRNRDS